MFLYDFATKTAQKPDTVATYIRRNEKIFKNHVERREKQLWLDEKAVKILLKKYPEVQRKKYPWWKNETEFEEAMVNAIKGLWDNQEILRKELDGILTAIAELQDAMDQKEPQKENNGLISLEEREKVIFRIQKTLARAKITNDMSEIATNLENTRVCGCF